MTTTDQIKAELSETTKLAEIASRGPWRTDADSDEFWVETFDGDRIDCSYSGDIDFIAAARTALPARDAALLVAVEAMSRYVGEKEAVKPACPCRDCNTIRSLATILSILNGESQ